MCLTEMQPNTELQPLLYSNNTELQYSLCTGLLSELKAKFITELTAVPDRTVTNDTELKERVLCCLLIAYCAAV